MESIYKIKSRLNNFHSLIDRNLPKKNKELLRKFERECYSQGLSGNRVLFYIYRLYVVAKRLKKDLDKATKEDIKNLIANIEQGSYSYKRVCKNGKTIKKTGSYSEWTKAGFKIAVKKFYQWLNSYEWKSEKYPEIVEWITTNARKAKLSDPIILTNDEVRALFRSAKKPLERALVTFMYESGCRCPDELLRMKVSDIEFDEYGAIVKLTSGKVGSRKIRVVSCVPCLKEWLEYHPSPKDDSYLWVGNRKNKMLSYAALCLMVRRWKQKAGINKPITPYTFRRTRYTHLAGKIPTPPLYKYMGQVQGSKTIDRYVNLSTGDIDSAILSFYGIKNANNDNGIKPLYCSRCNKQNAPDKEFCDICHAPLTEKARLKVEEKKKFELKDLIEELIKKRMEELRKEMAK